MSAVILTSVVSVIEIKLGEIQNLHGCIVLSEVHYEKGLMAIVKFRGLEDKVIEKDIPHGNLS